MSGDYFWSRKQSPNDVLDYSIDWQSGDNPFLLTGETITTSTWTAYNTGWTVETDITLSAPSHTTTATTVRISTAPLGTVRLITNHIVTSQGREKDETIKIISEEQ